MTLAVHATGLVKQFKDLRAVDGIDLQVHQGEVYGVLGPNGAGKTTMLRMLATLLRIDEGEAQIFGVDVRREPHQVRQLIGVTGQYASVDEKLTARENLRLFARIYGQSSKQADRTADDLLERFGLTDAATRTLEKFSGGMRRRLDLASSLIAQPPLIFLDEPTTGLDPRTRGQMWDTIRDLVAQGSTILLTTQYLDEADQLADRIAVIDRGRKVAEGTSGELKASVGSSTLSVQLSDPVDMDAAARSVAQALGRTANRTPESARLTVPLNRPDEAAEALIALRRNDISVAAVQVEQPTLDEVFLALTGEHVSDRAEGEADDDHDTRAADERLDPMEVTR
ncbi:ATP-binding cassette domain-containing protein [Luteipulveratus sp. YIM 133132]|uniref:ATP-binding cassette domain-containing protein n=1 Tax=Luteipulveratus flavus TaxID=3031728 RepID=UPI0023B1275E|nr:ATP-binding cassette domain-containing protein [Luteipulveratus sp. YIM 133132]MDE9366337.1 ATP-binding cassette domain-containing protein [Luteipulveratus sp. YIM 133132]